MKVFIWLLSVSSAFLLIGYIFWQQEIQYWTPTVKPDGVIEVSIGEQISIESLGKSLPLSKPLHVHFFNVDCPCSRFNLKEFELLVHSFHEEVDFIIVLQAEKYHPSKVKDVIKKVGKNLPVIEDKDGAIANTFGIYAAPQAVIIQKDGSIYYKGNYNINRYCTQAESAFAAQSLHSLLQNKAPKDYGLLASTPYGCVLPSFE